MKPEIQGGSLLQEACLARGVPEGFKEEKDAMALLARKHGSWLVTLGIEADVVTVLAESPAAVEETVLSDDLTTKEGRAVEHVMETKKHTETLQWIPMTSNGEMDKQED